MRSYLPPPHRKSGCDIPELSCPRCGLGRIYWMDKPSWMLGAPAPHYLCYNCMLIFHIPLPRKPDIFKLWRNG